MTNRYFQAVHYQSQLRISHFRRVAGEVLRIQWLVGSAWSYQHGKEESFLQSYRVEQEAIDEDNCFSL